ncbi:hypothetical protein HID58_023224 [Brassica napus]|uniref:Uncharacterized protein n=1 Tax=Brassica napus TaxID=3708 RepID=A0ABQ8D1G1_BRANA|nr:hypothetical protein HID58_023224 [Brassica napus]
MVGRLSTLGLIFSQVEVAVLFSIELSSAYGLSGILESPSKFFSVDVRASVGDFSAKIGGFLTLGHVSLTR